MTDADETHTFPIDITDLVTRRNQYRVVYCENTWSPVSQDRNVCVEADTTRWWLLDQGRWQNNNLIRRAKVIDDESESRTIAAYPILDYPDQPATQQDVSFYLGCDGEIYIYDEGVDEFSPFSPDDPFTSDDVLYLVEKLCLIRGE